MPALFLFERQIGVCLSNRRGDSRIARRFRPPLTGNKCDRRRWRKKGTFVGEAVDFVRRSKP